MSRPLLKELTGTAPAGIIRDVNEKSSQKIEPLLPLRLLGGSTVFFRRRSVHGDAHRYVEFVELRFSFQQNTLLRMLKNRTSRI